MLVAALACWCLLGATGVWGKTCPPKESDAISACVLPVAQYAEALGVGTKEPTSSGVQIVTGMGADVFKELCFLIKRFDDCVQNSRRLCPKHITLSLIDASYGYLCNEGYAIFMANANCLMKLDQEAQVRECHDSTLTVIRASSEEASLSLSAKMSRMCSSLNYFARCVRQPVQTTCGSEAWGVIVRVLKDTTKTLMPSCAFDTGPTPATTPALLPPPTPPPTPLLVPKAGLVTGAPPAAAHEGLVSASPASLRLRSQAALTLALLLLSALALAFDLLP